MPRKTKKGARSKRGKANPTSAVRVEGYQRAMRAMNLRAMGWTWNDIAGSAWPIGDDGQAVEGVLYGDRQKAQQAVDHLMRTWGTREVDAYRTEMIEQLDGLISANMDAACGIINGIESGVPIADALKAVQFAMERKAKILGLDAPTKSEVTGKDGKPLFDTGEGLGALLATADRMKAGSEPPARG